MDIAIAAGTAREVRALIARLILAEHAPSCRLGGITLAPHQIEAVSRIKEAVREFRGAFLCDAVGSGKTYIGLAVAAQWRTPVVIAPAALREMWTAAIFASDSSAKLITSESLSRAAVDLGECDGLIVDEAHHFRNAATKRYRALSVLAKRRPIVLMTATPIHNSRRDFENLGAIFLGSRARHLSALETTRLVIRRNKAQVRIHMPEVHPTEWVKIADDDTTVTELLNLPAPVPLRDAGEAKTLLAHGLIRQWASSEAALVAALKRRRAQAVALESALESGQYPTRGDLRSWILDDDTVQLTLPDLFAHTAPLTDVNMLRTVREYSHAVRRLVHERDDRPARLDDQRSILLGEIARSHPSTRIVAFASYEATLNALFERLLHSHRVACLTSHGARIAGGHISRSEAIFQFDPASPAAREAERIDLLLTTDLLSEGVNLQQAGVVVHLDIPWTAARLEQRIGRVARFGSHASSIFVFGFKPPASAERALRAATLVHSKWLAAASLIGAERHPGLGNRQDKYSASVPEIHEAICGLVATWANDGCIPTDVALVAAVKANHPGFLALVESGRQSFLLSDHDGITTEPALLYSAVECAGGDDAPLDHGACNHALGSIKKWIANKQSADIAGLGDAAFLRDRRKLFSRINSFASHSAPHTRFARKRMIENARRLASQTLGSEEERTLESSVLTDGRRIEELSPDESSAPHQMEDYRLRALLLLVTA